MSCAPPGLRVLRSITPPWLVPPAPSSDQPLAPALITHFPLSYLSDTVKFSPTLAPQLCFPHPGSEDAACTALSLFLSFPSEPIIHWEALCNNSTWKLPPKQIDVGELAGCSLCCKPGKNGAGFQVHLFH